MVDLVHASLAVSLRPREELEGLLVVLAQVVAFGLLRVHLYIVSVKFDLVDLQAENRKDVLVECKDSSHTRFRAREADALFTRL